MDRFEFTNCLPIFDRSFPVSYRQRLGIIGDIEPPGYLSMLSTITIRSDTACEDQRETATNRSEELLALHTGK